MADNNGHVCLKKAEPGKWTSMQALFTVPEGAYAGSFQFGVANQEKGEVLTITDAFAGVVPEKWQEGDPLPKNINNLIPNPKFRGGHVVPKGWKMQEAGIGRIKPAGSPEREDGKGISIEGSNILLSTDFPVRAGQRILFSIQARTTNPNPKIVEMWPVWRGTGKEVIVVGKTEADRKRNAVLLNGYDYPAYCESLTGYTGQDLQHIAFVRREDAVRTRVGPRGNYKAGMAYLPNGKLVIAVCRNENDPDPARQRFGIFVYESRDEGLTWQEIGETPLYGKEPSLTALPDGGLVLTGHNTGYSGPDAKRDSIPVSRSEDGGRTWETIQVPGSDYPRNLIVEADGSLLMVRALMSDWNLQGTGSPNLQLGRSKDNGRTWQFSEGIINWNHPGFGEVSAIRVSDGRLLAALRRQSPGTLHEGYEDTVVTESDDDGKHWSKPRPMSNNAEVHMYLTELNDGRILGTYSNYHLPWGVYAVVSKDGGRTWDLENPVQLALSADVYVGWAVTLQIPDHSLITSYAATTYYKQPPEMVTCETVRWHLPG